MWLWIRQELLHRGEPKVTDIIPGEGIAKDALMRTALALELKSEHPLAKAIVVYGRGTEDCNDMLQMNFRRLPGNGLSGTVSACAYFGGSLNFISEKSTVSKQYATSGRRTCKTGKNTAVFCDRSRNLLGIIAVADVIKEDSPQAISRASEYGNSSRYADRR